MGNRSSARGRSSSRPQGRSFRETAWLANLALLLLAAVTATLIVLAWHSSRG